MSESMTENTRGTEGRKGEARQARRGRRLRLLWGVSGLAAAGACALLVSGSAGAFGRHGHGFQEWRVERMLDEIEASDAQREQIRGALDELHDLWRSQRRARRDSHEAISAALTGDEIDRAALEQLRAAQVEQFEASSQQLLAALVRVAEVLTPEQRRQVAEEMREHREHREDHGPRGRQ